MLNVLNNIIGRTTLHMINAGDIKGAYGSNELL